MATNQETFVIECHVCQAKVAAKEEGRALKEGWSDHIEEPYGHLLLIGECPKCKTLLVGESEQLDFEGYSAEVDRWSDVVRVYPEPPKIFLSRRIPKVVKDSLTEAHRSLQAGANIAGCVMLGRALEALCRHVIEQHPEAPAAQVAASKATQPSSAKTKNAKAVAPSSAQVSPAKVKKIMLGEGITKLRDLGVIDKRLYDWSQQLQAFRNLAAHPEDITISKDDAADLQVFTNAIVEYVYDLSDRYEEFKARIDMRESRPRRQAKP